MDILLADEPASENNWTLLKPRDAQRSVALKKIAVRSGGRFSKQAWEQIDLPRLAGRRLLLSLCNQAPIFRRGDIVMIHDAQAFISPQSYSWAFRLWYRFALPQIGNKAAQIVTVSQYSKDKLVEHKVASADRISVVYNGIDHATSFKTDIGCLARLRLAAGTYVVALANAQRHKNIAVLFDAFRHLGPQGRKLVLVGAAGRSAFERAGTYPPPNVIFAGKVSDAELGALYENALCLAFPSLTEGFGLPPLEAMLVGCPAIVAPCGALPEVCGDAAIYVPPHDGKAWADAVESLARDESARAVLIEKGRLHASQFRWERSARQLLSIVDSNT
jgi:glycosyltransferase involved in cell wall biosynthesis